MAIDRCVCFKSVVTALLICAPGALVFSAGHPDLTVNSSVRIDEINSDIKTGDPTVDVGIYYPSNLDAAFVDAVPLSGLIDEFLEAKRVFAAAGVQLNLLWVNSAPIDPKYFSIIASNTEVDIPSDGYSNMYIEATRNPGALSEATRGAFEAIIGHDENNSRTVYLLVLQGVYTSYYETDDNGRNWSPRLVRTGGLSFPTYIHGNSIPTRMRGVITLTRHDRKYKRIVSHELGHKLMNVSHEYLEQSPQHEIVGEGGLMLYGSGTDIPSGEDGRWHRERLLMSPYIYRINEKGTRIWNPDYVEQGFYYDALYGDKVVHFDGVRLEPAQAGK